jgi:hypothetical protein
LKKKVGVRFFHSHNVLQLPEVGDFHHKCVCGALNRHFCQLKISEAKPVLWAGLLSVPFVQLVFIMILSLLLILSDNL